MSSSKLPFDLQPLSGYWVWFEALTEEVLALPWKEATPQLLAQLKKEGVTPKEVLARSAFDARRLGCPDYFKTPVFHLQPHSTALAQTSVLGPITPKFH